MQIIVLLVIFSLTPVFAYADSIWDSMMWDQGFWDSVAIPTLGVWGVFILTILLAASSIYVLKKRNNEKLFPYIARSRTLKYFFIVYLLTTSAVVVYAVDVPTTFSPNTVAKSEEVNANFDYLEDRSWELSGSNLYYNTGNVGIGTTSPSEKLEVNGNVKMGWERVSATCSDLNSCAVGCASGTRILGGGCNIDSGGRGEPLRDSYPNEDTAWICAVEDSTEVTITVYAICANMR